MTAFGEIVVKGPNVDGVRRASQQEMDHYILVAATLMSGSGAINQDQAIQRVFKIARQMWGMRMCDEWRFDEEVS